MSTVWIVVETTRGSVSGVFSSEAAAAQHASQMIEMSGEYALSTWYSVIEAEVQEVAPPLGPF